MLVQLLCWYKKMGKRTRLQRVGLRKTSGKGKGKLIQENYIILINYHNSLNIWFRSHFPSLFFSMTWVLITLALSAGAHSDTQTSRRLCKTLTSFSRCKCPALFRGWNRLADAKLLCLFQEIHCFNKQLPCLVILQLVSRCQSVSKNGSGGKIRQLIVSLSYIAAPHNC